MVHAMVRTINIKDVTAQVHGIFLKYWIIVISPGIFGNACMHAWAMEYEHLYHLHIKDKLNGIDTAVYYIIEIINLFITNTI